MPDAQAAPADVETVAAVVWSLARWLLEPLRAAGEPLPAHPVWAIAENRWRAAADGVEGELVDLDVMRPVATRTSRCRTSWPASALRRRPGRGTCRRARPHVARAAGTPQAARHCNDEGAPGADRLGSRPHRAGRCAMKRPGRARGDHPLSRRPARRARVVRPAGRGRARDRPGPPDGRPLPVRPVAAAAVLRRLAQAGPVPGRGRRKPRGAERRHPRDGAASASAGREAKSGPRPRPEESRGEPGLEQHERPGRRTGCRRRARARAGPDRSARSCAATASCTASASTCSSKNSVASSPSAEPAQAAWRSGRSAPTRSSRTRPGGRRSRPAAAGAGRRATSG